MIAATLMILATTPVAASRSASTAQFFQYQTVYRGTYSWDRYLRTLGTPLLLRTEQDYTFEEIVTHTVVLRPNGLTSTFETLVDVDGTLSQVHVQGGSGIPLLTTRIDCAVRSDPRVIRSSFRGGYVQPVPIRDNPQLTVGWQLPDARRRSKPRYTISGSPECAAYGSGFLVFTPTHPTGTSYARLSRTRAFDEAFSGSALIRYSDLRRTGAGYREWRRPISATLDGSGKGPPSAVGGHVPVESARVTIDAEVLFRRLGDPDSPDKIGALLLKDWTEWLFGRQVGPPTTSTGQPDTIVVPGLGTGGGFSIDVSGTVVGAGPQAREAGTGPILASGSTQVAADEPFAVTITPTPAGRRLLGGPHGPVRARYTLRFTPRGSLTPFTQVRTVTIPATG